MATAAQIAANRRNAQRSTGPRTAEGKERARLNAVRHGLAASTSVFLPHEDPASYHDMRGALIDTWQPANAQELLLVDQICQAWWMTERSTRYQNGFFSIQLRTMKARHKASEAPRRDDDTGIAIILTDPEHEAGCRTLFRYDDRAWSRYYRAIDRLRKLQADRRKAEKSSAAQCAAESGKREDQPGGSAEELASFGKRPRKPKTTPARVVVRATDHVAEPCRPEERPLSCNYVLMDVLPPPSSV